MSKKGIIVAGGAAAVVAPEAVDFDGTNDYLSRSSALSGSSDTGKTLTFSVWVYYEPITSAGHGVKVLDIGGGSYEGFTMRVGAYQTAAIVAQYNSSWATAINDVYNDSSTPIAGVPQSGWNHILYSVDLNNTTSSMYINDVLANPGTDGSSLVNQPMLFTTYGHQINIGRQHGTTSVNMLGRLAHLFLDYTYRDLSVEANRRHFVNANLTPNEAGMDAFSPILYMKMTDPSTVHINSGSGGNFTLNGTVALSGRGPNQYNAPASTFVADDDSLTRTSLTGVANSKVFTLSCSFKVVNPIRSGDSHFFDIGSGSISFRLVLNVTGVISILGKDSGPSVILNITDMTDSVIVADRWYTISISIDMSDTGKRHVYLDGVAQSPTWTTYVDSALDFTHSNYQVGRTNSPTEHWAGELSDLYFDTSYIDLSADNPFYDTDTGKPKDLGVDGSTPTGSSPLIYLPLRGNDAGDNRGTGGDFTVNSGPFTGARGPSEFWADSALGNGSAYLTRASLSGGANSNNITVVFSIFIDDFAAQKQWFNFNAGDLLALSETASSGFIGSLSPGPRVDYPTNTFTSGAWHNVLFSLVTNGTSGQRHFYVDGVIPASITWTQTGTIDLSATDLYNVMAADSAAQQLLGKLGFFYVAQEHIDFSVEANRLKFFDAFGYPVDLGSDGSTPTGSQPLIYLNSGFHLGTNLGSGGNFTPINTPTDGGHVKG